MTAVLPPPAPRRRRPYIIFTRLDDDSSRRREAWLEHRRLLLDATIEEDPTVSGLARRSVLRIPRVPRTSAGSSSAGLIVWRLFSGNHRQLAASARLFRDFEQARADAISVTTEARRAARLRTVEASGERFGWIMTVRSEAVLIAYHWFATRHDRNQQLQVAATALEGADVARTLDEVVEGHLDAWHRFPMLDREAHGRPTAAPIRMGRPINERPVRDLGSSTRSRPKNPLPARKPLPRGDSEPDGGS